MGDLLLHSRKLGLWTKIDYRWRWLQSCSSGKCALGQWPGLRERGSIHSTPRWLASDEDLGPPSFPIWQFRSPTSSRGDDGGNLIYGIDVIVVDFLRILRAWHVNTKDGE